MTTNTKAITECSCCWIIYCKYFLPDSPKPRPYDLLGSSDFFSFLRFRGRLYERYLGRVREDRNVYNISRVTHRTTIVNENDCSVAARAEIETENSD